MKYTKVLYSEIRKSEELKALVNKWFTRVNGANNHSFGYLFNGYVEAGEGEILSKIISPSSVSSVHADSGGLQVISRGFQITEEMKRSVYEVQAKYSNVAMSFDEIPVTVVF